QACSHPAPPPPAAVPPPVVHAPDPQPPLDPVQARRDAVKAALALLDQKRTDEALPLLAQAADANPGIAPYLRLRIVDAARASGKTADAIAAATRIVQDTPSSGAATVAKLRLPALYAAAGDAANTANTATSFEATK